MWSRALNLPPHDVVRFARGFWAVYWARTMQAAPGDLLQFAERRSTQQFVRRSGPLGDAGHPISVEDYCTCQAFLAHKQIPAEVLRLTAARDRLKGTNDAGT